MCKHKARTGSNDLVLRTLGSRRHHWVRDSLALGGDRREQPAPAGRSTHVYTRQPVDRRVGEAHVTLHQAAHQLCASLPIGSPDRAHGVAGSPSNPPDRALGTFFSVHQLDAFNACLHRSLFQANLLHRYAVVLCRLGVSMTCDTAQRRDISHNGARITLPFTHSDFGGFRCYLYIREYSNPNFARSSEYSSDCKASRQNSVSRQPTCAA